MTQIIESAHQRDIMSPARYIAKEWIEEAKELTTLWADSGMVPKAYLDDKNGNKPKTGAMIIAILMGRDLGLSPFASLQGIANINGMPAVWGDVMLGLCKACGHWGTMKEWDEDVEGDMTAFCEIHRHGDDSTYLKRFSMLDAQRAGLLEKETYKKYPRDMIANRARARALRAAYADVLKGMPNAEEARDVAFEVVGTQIGDGVDLSQAAPAAKKRGSAKPAAGVIDTSALVSGAEAPKPTTTAADPGGSAPAGKDEPEAPQPLKTVGEHVADATQKQAEPTPQLYGRDQTAALVTRVFADPKTKPALSAANARMGKKLSQCADGAEVDRFFRILTEEADKLAGAQS